MKKTVKIILLIAIIISIKSCIVIGKMPTPEEKRAAYENLPKEVEYDKTVYLYKTYNDYKNDISEDIDGFYSYAHNDITGSHLYFNYDFKDKKAISDYWGFKIDKFTFRSKKRGKNKPVAIVKMKEKVFYLNGEFYLDMISRNSKSGSITDDAPLFYSDNLNSEIFNIQKLDNKEKENKTYSKLFECLKEAKKRFGQQAEFNSSLECIMNF